MALYWLLAAVPATAVSKLPEMLGERPCPGAQQVSTPEYTDWLQGPALEQKIWVLHILQVAESQGRFSGLGVLVCFVLF